jgi:hypothetical protein
MPQLTDLAKPVAVFATFAPMRSMDDPRCLPLDASLIGLNPKTSTSPRHSSLPSQKKFGEGISHIDEYAPFAVLPLQGRCMRHQGLEGITYEQKLGEIQTFAVRSLRSAP